MNLKQRCSYIIFKGNMLNPKNDSLLNMKHKFNRDAITTLCLPETLGCCHLDWLKCFVKAVPLHFMKEE